MKNAHCGIFGALFLLYLAVRCLAWKSAFLLENHDSVFYLYEMKLLRNPDVRAILQLGPDSTPFYPLFGALCSLPGWSIETGARLCSLLFSLLLFVAVMGIGRQIADRSSVVIALIALSLNSVLVFLSISVLTEPSYIALVYAGFWLFLTQYDSPTLQKAGALGILFGLAFTDRTEGILFLVTIPLLQAIAFFYEKQKAYGYGRLIQWTVIYSLFFSLIAVPQILLVSSKMGRLAINGRQAWVAILNNPDGKSYDEKLNGLDFHPGVRNLEYIQKHPQVLNDSGFARGTEYNKSLLTGFKKNLKRFLGDRIVPLVGFPGLVLFIVGSFQLYRSHQPLRLLLVATFIAFNLIAPLVYNVTMRHVAVIAPLIILVGGMGFTFLANRILSPGWPKPVWSKYAALSLLVVSVFLMPAYPLAKKLVKPERFNHEYSPDEIRQPVSIVRERSREELNRMAHVSARKAYVAYYSDARFIMIPYTSYSGLVTWCRLNDIDFLFLQHRLVSSYPFLTEFLENNTDEHFSLLYRVEDQWGTRVELYRFKDRAPERRMDAVALPVERASPLQ